MKRSFEMAAVLAACVVAVQANAQSTERVITRRVVTVHQNTSPARWRQRPMRYHHRSEGEIRVILDGDRIRFPDQGPILENDHVLVPLRGVFEKMGATLYWDRARNEVTAVKDGKKVVVPLDGNSARIDGRRIPLDQPAELVNGRALVPLRFLSESFGGQVGWNAAEMTVRIDSK